MFRFAFLLRRPVNASKSGEILDGSLAAIVGPHRCLLCGLAHIEKNKPYAGWRTEQAGEHPDAAAIPIRDVYLRTSTTMLYTIAVVLIILWALGLVSSVSMGGLIHVLLVIAIIVVLLRVISGRKPI
jgi:hypothetical protein